MTSQIDFSKPVFGNPTTQSVRDNFQIANTEISNLQSGKLDVTGGTVSGPLTLNATFTVNSAPVTFNGSNSDGAIHIASVTQWPGVVFDINDTNGGAFVRTNRNLKARWILYLGDDSPESTGNAGTNFKISRFNDAGTTEIDFPITINRASGQVLINNQAMPQPANVVPTVEAATGVAGTVGTSLNYARQDHIHPSRTLYDGGSF
jgi:hypothetical protein